MDEGATEGRIFRAISPLALGALVGTLIGLSIHEVVGSTLAALLALLAGYFGLRQEDVGSRPAATRIALFSLACLAALLLSLYARTHNMLSPSLDAELRELKAQHVLTDEDVRSITLFKKFGLVPAGFTGAQPDASRSDTIVFANPDAWDCTHLQADLFATPQERLEAMRTIGGAWTKLAEQAAGADPARQAELMQHGFEQRCSR